MGAGASAEYEATRSLLEAGEYDRLRRDALNRAQRYRLASRTEASVGAKLEALETLGWRVLADRRWAGSKRANADFLLVGPGGVVVADVKAWRHLQVRNDSVFCDDECRDDEVSKLLSLTARVEDCVRELGLTRQAIWPMLVFAGRRVSARAQQVDLVGEANVAVHVTRLGQRLSEEEVDAVCALIERDFVPYDVTPVGRVRVPAARVVVARPKETQPDTLFDVQELTDSLLETALAGPIESWMTFLHPDQLKLVSTSWNGPARVRGPAGTGKTVVGLHRAAYLAERSPRRVLFVTFVRTLPVVLGSLCERMSPAARANIHFTGLHKLAIDLIESAGSRITLDAVKANTAFARAWASTGRGSVLTRLDERWSYWKEEIDYVIKGRGLTDFDEYAELVRLGRRTPMRFEHRAAMWDLYSEYERLLDRAGVQDFNDAIIVARDFVRSGEAPHDFGSVVVDEVQDLNLVGVELLHAIAGDGPDRFLIIGDGQQSVYPGGFTLAEAGISVVGRATVLRSNYRNAAEILELASTVVADDSFDDLEGVTNAGKRELDVRRTGGTTVTVRARTGRDLEAALITQIREAREVMGVDLADMAVLGFKRSDAAHYRGVLADAGLPTVDLLEYDGVSSDRIKVGTFKRAKGLEFKYVLLPGLSEGLLEQWSGESEESHRERAERMRRELFVGMTRARDGLWLGYLEPLHARS